MNTSRSRLQSSRHLIQARDAIAGRPFLERDQDRRLTQELGHPGFGEIHVAVAHPGPGAGQQNAWRELLGVLDLLHAARPRDRIDRPPLPGQTAQDRLRIRRTRRPNSAVARAPDDVAAAPHSDHQWPARPAQGGLGINHRPSIGFRSMADDPDRPLGAAIDWTPVSLPGPGDARGTVRAPAAGGPGPRRRAPVRGLAPTARRCGDLDLPAHRPLRQAGGPREATPSHSRVGGSPLLHAAPSARGAAAGHGLLPANRARARRDRDRAHLVRHAPSAHAGGHGGHLPAPRATPSTTSATAGWSGSATRSTTPRAARPSGSASASRASSTSTWSSRAATATRPGTRSPTRSGRRCGRV